MTPPDLSRGFVEALKSDWHSLARPEQLPPAGDWTTWVFCGGRGAGKTRSGAEWVQGRVEAGIARRIHLIAPTAADTRDVLLEGPAGILSIATPHMRPVYSPSLRKVSWPNGAQALLFSSDEPDRLRGPQADTVWIDELCAMRLPQEVLDMSMFGLRVGKDPRCLITTTPRPIKCFKQLLARDGQDVTVTRGSTFANAENLARPFLEQITSRYQGTRLGRQELYAELLMDTPGALWSLETLEATRVSSAPPLQRIVVAIDPAGSSTENADETGIIIAGIGHDGHGYVFSDLSGRYAPHEWARQAIRGYHAHQADRIIAETNYGGAMVEATISSVDPQVPVKTISSSRGKVLRAEPIAALFEQRRVHMVGSFPELEDQLCSFTADWSRARDGSPDRVDAMVFALAELMCGQPVGGFFKEASLLDAKQQAEASGSVLDITPIDMPAMLEGCFAAIGTAPNNDAVGVVYFGSLAQRAGRLIVLDWDLWQFDGVSLGEWLTAVKDGLNALRVACRAHSARGGIWIDQTPVGAALLAQGIESGLEVHDIAEHTTLAQDLAVRASAAGRFVGGGRVKIARPAHEKITTFGAVTRNHLLSQILSFGIGTEPPQSGELLYAFCTGCVLGLEENPPR